jgi:hypothetical protein
MSEEHNLNQPVTIPYDPGNITIDSCDLVHANGKLSLLGAMNEFRISFSTHEMSSLCGINVLDTTDTLADLDPDGTEVLTIGWHSEGDREIKQTYSIFKTDIQLDPNMGNGKLYSFTGISHTHMQQLTMDVNRSFSGTIKDFVKNIFREIPQKIQTYAPIDVHETTGISTLIIPGETPFEAIERLTNRAFSSTYSSSVYQFYQNSKGYCFHNIEQLIAEGRKNATTYVYTPNGAVADDLKTIAGKFMIVDIEFPMAKDIIHKIMNGAYASSVKEIDIIGQKIDTTELKVKENFNDFYHLDQPAMTLDKINVINEKLNVSNTTKWVHKYFDGNRHLDFKWGPQITKRKFYADSLDQLQMNAVIHGNSNLDCGDIIDLSMLERSGNTSTPEQEKKISGKYIIDTIVHYYKNGSYACTLQCSKESNRANVSNLDEYIIGDK